MAISAITTGAQTVTAAGAVTGTLDTSASTGDYTVKLDVSALSPSGAVAIIALEDTSNATPFTSDAVQVAVFQVVGTTLPIAPISFDVRQYQIPGTRYGIANSKLRFKVLSLSGASPSLTLNGYLQN